MYPPWASAMDALDSGATGMVNDVGGEVVRDGKGKDEHANPPS